MESTHTERIDKIGHSTYYILHVYKHEVVKPNKTNENNVVECRNATEMPDYCGTRIHYLV